MPMKVRYTVLDGEIVHENRAGTERDYVPDPLGSTVALLDNTQTQTDIFTYWPYGETGVIFGNAVTPFMFVGTRGYYNDSSAGRTYVRARSYRQDHGRWLTNDPIGYAGGENLYEYCSGRPVYFVDPSGLDQYALWFGCNTDWRTFQKHARHAAGKNIFEYDKGKDIVDRVRLLKNVDKLYIYGHGWTSGLQGYVSHVGADNQWWLIGLYPRSLDHAQSPDYPERTLRLHYSGGAATYEDLADAIKNAGPNGFRPHATIYFASCHADVPAKSLSQLLKDRGRGDIRVVGSNDWSNGSEKNKWRNPKYFVSDGKYLWFQGGQPIMIDGTQKSQKSLP